MTDAHLPIELTARMPDGTPVTGRLGILAVPERRGRIDEDALKAALAAFLVEVAEHFNSD